MGDTVPLIVNLGYLILDFRDCIREYAHHQRHADFDIHVMPLKQYKSNK